MAHRALSTQPALGGPIYFVRNIVYNAPEGGSLKLTANSAGVLVYNNTLLSEAHQMGPASNLHFRNNLILGQGSWPEVFSVETFTPWSSSDFNGFAAAAAGPSLFAWAAPVSGADYGARGERPIQSFPTLKAYADRTGQDSHSRMVDWSVFRKASPPAPGDPTHLYRPEDFDFSLDCGVRSNRCRYDSSRSHRWLCRQGARSRRAGIWPACANLRSAAACRATMTDQTFSEECGDWIRIRCPSSIFVPSGNTNFS